MSSPWSQTSKSAVFNTIQIKVHRELKFFLNLKTKNKRDVSPIRSLSEGNLKGKRSIKSFKINDCYILREFKENR